MTANSATKADGSVVNVHFDQAFTVLGAANEDAAGHDGENPQDQRMTRTVHSAQLAQGGRRALRRADDVSVAPRMRSRS